MKDDDGPLLRLPGFMPDALPFAARTALAALLAYFFAFAAQVPSAASAGVTVGIVAQPSAGMALSKAFYRVAGTLIGCVVAIALGAAFGQDRTMLLLAFALWMAACTATATLLRDFRSYGAAISGYTVAIIAIGGIDAPEGLFLSAVNRTAAILIGVGATALVNALAGGTSARATLAASLARLRTETQALAVDALEGRPVPADLPLIRRASAIMALRTEAGYAASEHTDGAARRRGAQLAISSLLTALSASRSLAGAFHDAPSVHPHLAATARALESGTAPPDPPVPATPAEALLIDRAAALHAAFADIDRGLRALDGHPAPLPPVTLPNGTDRVAALINAARVLVAFGLAATFIVLSGYAGATLVLIQQAAFVGLLGTMPTPTRSSVAFLVPLLPATLITGLVEFHLLPLAEGPVPFALCVGILIFATALIARQATLAPYAPAALIYVTLLIAPSNPQTFDLAVFLDTAVQVGLAVLFTVGSFVFILPVSPKRRLYRLVAAVALRLHRRRGPAHPAAAQALLYDRLSQALLWLGRPTPARANLLSLTYRLGLADIACHRARAALAVADLPRALRSQVDAALAAPGRARLSAAAAALLAATATAPAIALAAALADAALQNGPGNRATRFDTLVTGSPALREALHVA